VTNLCGKSAGFTGVPSGAASPEPTVGTWEAGSLHGKARNDLWFALVHELKILFFQIRDDFAVIVADDDANED